MKIINTSRELTKVETYELTKSPKVAKLSTRESGIIDLDCFLMYEDVNQKTGEVQTIVSIKDRDGRLYATNSPTFTREFCDLVEIFGSELHKIELVRGNSKNGRQYMTCAYCE